MGIEHPADINGNTQAQFRKDRLTQAHLAYRTQRKMLGVHPQTGKPQAFYVWRKGTSASPQTLEMTADLDLDERLAPTGDEVMPENAFCLDSHPGKIFVPVGALVVCPRCGSSNYLRGVERGGRFVIHPHWDGLEASEIEGGNVYRPKLSILGGSFSCDMSWHEVNGVVQPKTSNVLNRCGFKCEILEGQLIER